MLHSTHYTGKYATSHNAPIDHYTMTFDLPETVIPPSRHGMHHESHVLVASFRNRCLLFGREHDLLVCSRLNGHAPGLHWMESRVASEAEPGCGSKNGLSCTFALCIAAYFASDLERTDYTAVSWQQGHY